MAQNIEIKSKSHDFKSQKNIAEKLATDKTEIIFQKDVFFNVPSGRLKLRIFSADKAELIYYTRPNQQGPKLSNYTISPTRDPSGLESTLKQACGVRATVVKKRYLVISGRTRIHFDEVEGLGNFIELEVVLADGEKVSDGESEAQLLMDKLGIKPEHLIECAYVDLLEKLDA